MPGTSGSTTPFTPRMSSVDGQVGAGAGPGSPELEAAALEPSPCPECFAGKCRNCDDTTWSDVRDELTACPCSAAGHQAMP